MLLSHGPNKAFLVPDSCRVKIRHGNIISTDVIEDTFEKIRTTHVSALSRHNTFPYIYNYIATKQTKKLAKRLALPPVSKARTNIFVIGGQYKYIFLYKLEWRRLEPTHCISNVCNFYNYFYY